MTAANKPNLPVKAAIRLPSGYPVLLGEIKIRIRSAQYEALKAVNKELVQLYWDIGRVLTERQAAGAYGQTVVKRLASDLQQEFPGIAGFSWRNLFYMTEFYAAYRDQPKLQPLVAIIGWTHNLIIWQKCKDPLAREFYIRMTRKFGWTKDVLAVQIENQAYEKTLLNQTNFDRAVPAKYRDQAKLAVRDDYTFGFLELGEEHSERELERAILAKIEKFLREMGGRFAFLGSQFRLEVAGEEYFIDLLLFHRALRCLFAVDLKIGAFKPEFVGKMQFYLATLDAEVRMPGENPSIGMILCRTKERAIVEYALRETHEADEADALGIAFTPTIKKPYRWRDWAAPDCALRQDTKASVWKFVHEDLLPHLKGLKEKRGATPRQKVISEVMSAVSAAALTRKRTSSTCWTRSTRSAARRWTPRTFSRSPRSMRACCSRWARRATTAASSSPLARSSA
jgi:predicted nuclease of restriction endonuclease-like (RecB) superfamily